MKSRYHQEIEMFTFSKHLILTGWSLSRFWDEGFWLFAEYLYSILSFGPRNILAFIFFNAFSYRDLRNICKRVMVTHWSPRDSYVNCVQAGVFCLSPHYGSSHLTFWLEKKNFLVKLGFLYEVSRRTEIKVPSK